MYKSLCPESHKLSEDEEQPTHVPPAPVPIGKAWHRLSKEGHAVLGRSAARRCFLSFLVINSLVKARVILDVSEREIEHVLYVVTSALLLC